MKQKLTSIQSRLKAPNQSRSFFTPAHKKLIDYLSENLLPDMSISELPRLIALIECIQIKDKSAPYALNGLAQNKQQRILVDFIPPKETKSLDGEELSGFFVSPKNTKSLNVAELSEAFVSKTLSDGYAEMKKIQASPLSLTKDSPLILLLLEAHTLLITLLETNMIKANTMDLAPEKKIYYSNDQIDHSPEFSNIATSSQKLQLKDQADILYDLRRGLVLIDHQQVIGKNDQTLCQIIENFTGDKIETPGSRANKIFNFGGQYLHANLAREYSAISLFEGEFIQAGFNYGYIDWHKDSEGQISATVMVKNLAFTTQNTYIVGTDGTSLVGLDLLDARHENIQGNLGKEMAADIHMRVPTGYILVTIQLDLDKEHGYYLKPTTCEVGYYTDELTCTHESNLDLAQNNNYFCLAQ